MGDIGIGCTFHFTGISNAFEGIMWFRWEVDMDRIAGANFAAGEDNAYDARFADEIAVGVVIEYRGHETRLEIVELLARVA